MKITNNVNNIKNEEMILRDSFKLVTELHSLHDVIRVKILKQS